MDTDNLLFFTMGRIYDHNSDSCGKTTEPVARKQHYEDVSSKTKQYRLALKNMNSEKIRIKKDMVWHVARMGVAVDLFTSSSNDSLNLPYVSSFSTMSSSSSVSFSNETLFKPYPLSW